MHLCVLTFNFRLLAYKYLTKNVKMTHWKYTFSSCQKLLRLSSPSISKGLASSYYPHFSQSAACFDKRLIKDFNLPVFKHSYYISLNAKRLFLPTTFHIRCIHLSHIYGDKSKLEDSLKEKQKKRKDSLGTDDSLSGEQKEKSKKAAKESVSSEVVKPSLWKRFVAEVKHYYHGFRLLGLDIRIAFGSLRKLVKGKQLVRRERNQFRRALSDIFRLAPFSVFVLIPFAEFALPFVLKFFPGMLPSTFETTSKRENRLKTELKVKLEMAKFLQDTVEDIAVHTNKSTKKTEAAKKFVEFFQKTRSTNEAPTNEEILEHAKLFKDDLTLDNIDRPQLVALCRLIKVPAVGTNEVLRFLIQIKLNALHRDDKLIMAEGVESLTTAELVTACQARGMRALGVTRKRLKQQLSEWVDLHVKHDVPSSLLLLSRVLYLPDSVPAEERVKAAISTLPEKVADKAEVTAAELNLERADNVARYKAAKQERAEIFNEEAAKVQLEKSAAIESMLESKPDVLVKEKVSEGPVLTDSARVIKSDNKITQKEIDVIDDAISQFKSTKKVETDTAKVELGELREDVEEYKSDVESLTAEIKHEEYTAELQNVKAGKLLQKRINKMIGSMEVIIADLEKSTKQKDGGAVNQVAIHELVHTIQAITKLPKEKLRLIFVALDSNKDGHIDVDEARKTIKLLNQEDVEVTSQQLEQIGQLLAKEIGKGGNTAKLPDDKQS